MSTVLETRDLRKSFGQTAALQGADLSLQKGEWLALLGPNGAGKTTLIRCVAGRIRPDSGEMRLYDRPLNGDARLRTRLGIVPQEIALYPLLTPRENMAVFGELNGLRGAVLRDRIAWALSWTGLSDRANEHVKGFSGGMKRRLNIACGILHQPEIVLLDEPTVGVDPQSRERIWEMCDELRRGGASLLLTTHQLDEAQKVCDRIVIIDRGRAIAAGTLPELVAQTIGPTRRVTLTLAEPPAVGLVPDGFEIEGRTLTARVRDLAGELPGLLLRLRDVGSRVEDVHIDAPSLQAVFIHLTGRELRE